MIERSPDYKASESMHTYFLSCYGYSSLYGLFAMCAKYKSAFHSLRVTSSGTKVRTIVTKMKVAT